jgi:predicted PurR-regulated permease PerM
MGPDPRQGRGADRRSYDPAVTVLERWGRTGWRVLGIILAATASYALLVAFSGLVVPLLFAILLGIIGVPLVDRLEAVRVPRALGALLVIIGLLGVLVLVAVVVLDAFVEESDFIRITVQAGAADVHSWFAERDLGEWSPDATVDAGIEQGQALLTGAATWFGTVFSGVMSFALGAFISLFMLYYVLVDWASVRAWLAPRLGVPGSMGEEIVQDGVDVVRRGFGALTLTSLITSSLIGLVMIVLGLPFAMAVTVVTFITSYVPYLGAIVSGAFGFLIALGAGGPDDAIVMLITILVVQNVVQTVVGNKITSDRLRLRPLPSIISSVCGVAIAGLLGAILSAPALALGLAVHRRLSVARLEPDHSDGRLRTID